MDERAQGQYAYEDVEIRVGENIRSFSSTLYHKFLALEKGVICGRTYGQNMAESV